MALGYIIGLGGVGNIIVKKYCEAYEKKTADTGIILVDRDKDEMGLFGDYAKYKISPEKKLWEKPGKAYERVAEEVFNIVNGADRIAVCGSPAGNTFNYWMLPFLDIYSGNMEQIKVFGYYPLMIFGKWSVDRADNMINRLKDMEVAVHCPASEHLVKDVPSESPLCELYDAQSSLINGDIFEFMQGEN